MKPSAILYNSNTGFTERYAKMLGEKTGLPVFSAENPPKKGTAVIYMGWLMAGHISGIDRAVRLWTIWRINMYSPPSA